MQYRSHESGQSNPLLVASILLAFLCAGLAGFGIWAFSNYQDHKNNVDTKVAAAVNVAKKDQASVLEKQFVEREKQPYTKFNGPDDLGRVSFDYPKTWSVYQAKVGAGGEYEAYFNPGVVPTISSEQPFATRVVIASRSYDDTIKSFENAVKTGKLKSAPITINNFTGIRLDGEFSKQRTGSAVVFKIRDKSLIISSDANTFKNDFDTVIIKSLDFNP